MMFPLLECCRARALLEVGDFVVANIVDVALAGSGGETTLSSFWETVPVALDLELHLLVELDRLAVGLLH